MFSVFQPNEKPLDNFDPVDLSWLRCTKDPLKVLRHGATFLEDPSKIDDNNHSVWCNLHITPALKGVVVEVRSLEEVAHWTKKQHLESASDPMETGVANMIVALGNNPWPCTLRLARVLVALGQKLCSLTEAVDSAKECFNREQGLEAAHYYLTPVSSEAPFLLSDAGIQAEDGTAIAIGMVAIAVNPADNAVNLSASEGVTSNLVLCHLLHLSVSLVLIPLQLSHPVWTGIRRMKIGYESFIHFSSSYLPPNVPESECNLQQLSFMGDLHVPELQVLVDIAEQLDSFRTGSPQPEESVSRLGDKDGTKDETSRKTKPGSTEDTLRKHRSHKEKGHLKQSPSALTCKPMVNFKADKLGTAVAQACLSITRMSRVVDNVHNSKIAEALLRRQCLEKASAEAIDLAMEEIQGACTTVDIW